MSAISFKYMLLLSFQTGFINKHHDAQHIYSMEQASKMSEVVLFTGESFMLEAGFSN